MNFFKCIVLLILPIFVIACGEISDDELNSERLSFRQSSLLSSIGKDKDRIKPFLSNATISTWSSHGTQIEFLNANGKTSLWYPGNAAAVQGEWRIDYDSLWPDICFRYGVNTFNPITKTRGGNWDCSLASNYLRAAEAVQSGDVFKLSRGRVPYILPKGRFSLDVIGKNAGLNLQPFGDRVPQ